jgi:hypothetical protein
MVGTPAARAGELVSPRVAASTRREVRIICIGE